MIETQRLHLRITDQPEMARLIAAEPDEEMRRAYTEMLDGCLSHPDQWPWYAVWMIELPDGTRVGDLCFKGLPPTGAVEIGYGILDEFQCRGYATEAVAAPSHGRSTSPACGAWKPRPNRPTPRPNASSRNAGSSPMVKSVPKGRDLCSLVPKCCIQKRDFIDYLKIFWCFGKLYNTLSSTCVM